MLIKFDLHIKTPWKETEYVIYPVIKDVPKGVFIDRVCTYCTDKKQPWLFVEDLLVHDVFHHKAMDLGYTKRDEYLTCFLDFSWPWYVHNYTRSTHPDIASFKESLKANGQPIPTASEVRKLLIKARQNLRYLNPSSYKRLFCKAITTYLSKIPKHKLDGHKFHLVIITENRTVIVKPGPSKAKEKIA